MTCCLRARQYRTFCAWAEQYRTSSRSGSRKLALWPVWARGSSKSTLYKGILRGSHRPTFSIILGVLSVLDGLLAQLGGEGYVTFCLRARQYRTFDAWAKECRTFSRSGSRKWDLASLGQKQLKVDTFNRIFTGNRRPIFSRVLGVLSVLDGQPSLGTKGT